MLQCRAEISERRYKVAKCVTRISRSVPLCGSAAVVVSKRIFCFRTIDWTKPNSMKCPPHCWSASLSSFSRVFYRKAMEKRGNVIMTWSLSSKNADLLCLSGAINWMPREPNNTVFQGIICSLLKSYIPRQVLIFSHFLCRLLFFRSLHCFLCPFLFLVAVFSVAVAVPHFFVLVHFNNFIVRIA